MRKRGDPRLPPSDIASRKIETSSPTGLTAFRCALSARPLIDWDNRANSRFSSPDHPFPVLYLAETRHTGFWECFGDNLLDMHPGDRVLSRSLLKRRVWVDFTLDKPLPLADLTRRDVLAAIGADTSTLLAPYQVTQAWSRALMEHPGAIAGFWYRSRLDAGRRCLALFGRPEVEGSLNGRKGSSLMEDHKFLEWLLEQDIGLVD